MGNQYSKPNNSFVSLLIFIILNLFQIVNAASIGDRVWEDLNANGKQDTGEPGINGIKMKLYYDQNIDGIPDGAEIKVVYTAFNYYGNGYYNFDNLLPGTYIIQAEPATEYYISPQDSNITIDLLDSDFSITTRRSKSITLASSDQITDIDLGIFKLGKVGDFIWFDQDKNGRQDPGEAGINQFTIKLYDDQGKLISQTQSFNQNQSDGHFSLQARPGNYYLTFEPSSVNTYYPTLLYNSTATLETNNDVYLQNGIFRTELFTLNSNGFNSGIDAGFTLNQSVGQQVWLDLNKNGIKENEEQGMDGITIQLYNATTQNLVKETVSSYSSKENKFGFYTFDQLLPGNYFIKTIIPDHHYFSPFPTSQNQTTNKINHNNGFGTSSSFSLNYLQENKSMNVALYVAYNIGQSVWNDFGVQGKEGNGIQDNGEQVEVGLPVAIKNSAGKTVDSTQTDQEGKYNFLVSPGTYFIKFYSTNGKQFTGSNKTNDDFDSDVTGAYGEGTTSLFTVGNSNLMHIDAGLIFSVLALEELKWSLQSEKGKLKILWQCNEEERVTAVQKKTANDIIELKIGEHDSEFVEHEEEGQYYRLQYNANQQLKYTHWKKWNSGSDEIKVFASNSALVIANRSKELKSLFVRIWTLSGSEITAQNVYVPIGESYRIPIQSPHLCFAEVLDGTHCYRIKF
ncbi:MAG TPA: SdrD B-like domain-containing protein [Saprospiraceae bacterium]|nr:SdrD B-like domain-containing protein [Saprospiraceae bacterium]